MHVAVQQRSYCRNEAPTELFLVPALLFSSVFLELTSGPKV